MECTGNSQNNGKRASNKGAPSDNEIKRIETANCLRCAKEEALVQEFGQSNSFSDHAQGAVQKIHHGHCCADCISSFAFSLGRYGPLIHQVLPNFRRIEIEFVNFRRCQKFERVLLNWHRNKATEISWVQGSHEPLWVNSTGEIVVGMGFTDMIYLEIVQRQRATVRDGEVFFHGFKSGKHYADGSWFHPVYFHDFYNAQK